MAKIHPIEKCVVCGRLLKPLIPDNYDDLYSLKKTIENFIDNSPKGENVCFGMYVDIGLFDDKADITWFICSNCCRHFTLVASKYAINFRKKILFQKFDGATLGLKNKDRAGGLTFEEYSNELKRLSAEGKIKTIGAKLE